MNFALMLKPYPDERWTLARQMGVSIAVTSLPKPEGGAPLPWDFLPILHLKKRFDDAGLNLSVIEGNPTPMNKVRLGLPGRDEEIEHFCVLVQNMGAVGIPILCYNFMAQFGWLRTSVTTRTRGGALATSFDYNLVKDAPLTEAGIVTDEQLWDNFHYFLKKVVPVAERAKVKLALHPDDPPLSPIRGVARIFRNIEAFQRAIEMVPSDYNGITFCQANFAAMGVNIPDTIRYFGGQDKIFFVHFRDIKGTAACFEETFHDDGQTDMLEAMRCYKETGFSGPIRPDHAPTMEGEVNNTPGYEMLGRIFAIGYMKGLSEAIERNKR